VLYSRCFRHWPARCSFVSRRLAGFARALLFAGLWTLAEWTRTWAFTGFPWLAAGYSQTPPSPLAGYAPLLGLHGVTLASALIGALVLEVVRRWLSSESCGTRSLLRWCPALPLLATAVVLAAGGLLREVRWTQTTGEPLSVALLQGNVAQEMKWRPERFVDSLRTYYRLALENPAQLTVLPETALPAFLDQIPGEYLDALRQLALRQQGDLLLGIAIADGRQYFNAALSLGASGQQHYSKSHLVPFGEFVPPRLCLVHGHGQHPDVGLHGRRARAGAAAPGRPARRREHLLRGCLRRGDHRRAAGRHAAGQHLQRGLVRRLAGAGTALADRPDARTRNRPHDAARDQHRHDRHRRCRRHVRSVLPPFTRGALVGEVQGYSGATPYVRWGNWPVIAVTYHPATPSPGPS
jgi:apolipoprotein N-acyltransferase